MVYKSLNGLALQYLHSFFLIVMKYSSYKSHRDSEGK